MMSRKDKLRFVIARFIFPEFFDNVADMCMSVMPIGDIEKIDEIKVDIVNKRVYAQKWIDVVGWVYDVETDTNWEDN